ncbi:hypothetical protein E2C01_099926 [Portunus trituberculatus]|uniref:Uncharacterized protein n=1 Tax=Portunus trituberculatus TaxID=210409 RepID=A0A5B7KGM0_PORTR|nr:hypothetical protein [Portunus trituberculatus]
MGGWIGGWKGSYQELFSHVPFGRADCVPASIKGPHISPSAVSPDLSSQASCTTDQYKLYYSAPCYAFLGWQSSRAQGVLRVRSS